jgi:hypothetical protein
MNRPKIVIELTGTQSSKLIGFVESYFEYIPRTHSMHGLLVAQPDPNHGKMEVAVFTEAEARILIFVITILSRLSGFSSRGERGP